VGKKPPWLEVVLYVDVSEVQDYAHSSRSDKKNT
jgi:hypothetical protein